MVFGIVIVIFKVHIGEKLPITDGIPHTSCATLFTMKSQYWKAVARVHNLYTVNHAQFMYEHKKTTNALNKMEVDYLVTP